MSLGVACRGLSVCATLSVAQDSNCTAEPTLELPLDTTMGGNLDVEGTLTVRGVDVSGGGGPTVETVDADMTDTWGYVHGYTKSAINWPRGLAMGISADLA